MYMMDADHNRNNTYINTRFLILKDASRTGASSGGNEEFQNWKHFGVGISAMGVFGPFNSKLVAADSLDRPVTSDYHKIRHNLVIYVDLST